MIGGRSRSAGLRSDWGDSPIRAILYVKKSAADEEPGKARTVVSLSVDGFGMRGFGW